jgi:coatomer protein complex subunit alpha (xenin)
MAEDENDVKKVISECREYLFGIAIEKERKETNDPKRSIELAAYFTHCNLQTVHLQLAIRLAMVQAFKMKNYGTASKFAERLLEQGPPPQVVSSVNILLNRLKKSWIIAREIKQTQ